MVLRAVGIADIDWIAETERLCFSDSWSAEALSGSLEDRFSVMLIAEENGIPLGYLLAGRIFGEASLFRIATLPEQRKKGIATALLSQLVNDSDSVILEVREHNAAAISLYESLGFQKISRIEGFYVAPPEAALVYKIIR